MLRYLLHRILLLLLMLLGIAVVVFGLLSLLPGDPAAVFLGENATPEAVAELRKNLGLDRPWPVRLARHGAGLLQGDLGASLFQRRPVATIVAERLPATLELTFATLVLALVAGMTLGILAALKKGSLADVVVMAFAQLGVSMPVFWLGILLTAFFAVHLAWFPAIGRGEPLLASIGLALAGDARPLTSSLGHLFLPAVTLAVGLAAVLSRLVRAALLETLHEDYVRGARARGLGARRVLLGHAPRNALLPVVSVLGVRLGTLLGGSVLTESIFGWPGLGHLAVTAISQRDFPLVQGIVLVFATTFLAVQLLIDLGYGVLDPRIRLERGGASSAAE